MSLWTHLLCDQCWTKREPDRPAVRVKDFSGQPCCLCGALTNSGIFVREDPKQMTCGGRGVVHL